MRFLVFMVLIAAMFEVAAGKRDYLDFTSCVAHEDYLGIEKIKVKPKSKPKSKPKTKPKTPIAATNYFELGEDIDIKIYGTPSKTIDGGVVNVNITGPEEFGLQRFEADFCELVDCPLHAGKRYKTKFKIETDECIPAGNYTIRSTVTSLMTDEELTCVEAAIVLQEDPEDKESPFVPKPI